MWHGVLGPDHVERADVVGRPVDEQAQHRVDVLPRVGAPEVGVRAQVVDAGQRQPRVDRVLVEDGVDLDHLGARGRPARRRPDGTAPGPPRRSRRSRAWATTPPSPAAGDRRGRRATRPRDGAATAGRSGRARPPRRGRPPGRPAAGPSAPWSTGGPSPARCVPPDGTRPSEACTPTGRSTPTGSAATRLRRTRWPAAPCRRRWPRPTRPTNRRGCARGSTGCGWRPNSGLSVSAFQPSSGVFVLPTTTHPAATSRATRIESVVAGGPSGVGGRARGSSRSPAASSRSFTPSGMPASGPGSPPAATMASTAAAAARATLLVDGHEGVDRRRCGRRSWPRAWSTSSDGRHRPAPDLGRQVDHRSRAEVHVSTVPGHPARQGAPASAGCTRAAGPPFRQGTRPCRLGRWRPHPPRAAPSTGTVLDHVAHAVPRWQDVWHRYATDLGAEWTSGGPGPGFAPGQLRFANGARVEVLMPWDVEVNDFLARFLAPNGPGPHHLTFKVPDLEARHRPGPGASASTRSASTSPTPSGWRPSSTPSWPPASSCSWPRRRIAWSSPPPTTTRPSRRQRGRRARARCRPAALAPGVPRGGRPRSAALGLFGGLLGGVVADEGTADGLRWVDLPGPARSASAWSVRPDADAGGPGGRAGSTACPGGSTTSRSRSRSPTPCPGPRRPTSASAPSAARPPGAGAFEIAGGRQLPGSGIVPATAGVRRGHRRPPRRAGSLTPMAEPTDDRRGRRRGRRRPRHPRRAGWSASCSPGADRAPPSRTLDRRGDPTKWSIDRLDGRERLYCYAASGLAVVFAVLIYVEETTPSTSTRSRTSSPPPRALLVGLAAGVPWPSPPGSAAGPWSASSPCSPSSASGLSTIVGLPFLVLAVWLLYRSYKVQKEATARLRADRAAGQGRGTAAPPDPRPSAAAGSRGRRRAAGARRPRPGPRPTSGTRRRSRHRKPPPPPKPSWRERRAAKASD